jgi:hypothetical protein
MFTNKVGLPTILVTSIVLLFSLSSLPGFYRYFRTQGIGQSYRELTDMGVSHAQARERAMQDGTKSGILMILGQEIPLTMLVLVAIGLISKSTTIQFKRALRVLYPSIAAAGVFFLSLGVTYWRPFAFPFSLAPSLMLYVALSVVLWGIIGIGVLIRGRQHLRRKTDLDGAKLESEKE